LPKLFFPEGMAAYIKLKEIPEGWEGGILCSINGNSGEEGGLA